MRKLLVVLIFLAVVVGVLGVIADPIARNRAEDEIGRQVAAQYNLSTQPEVTFHGFSFLLQALQGEYEGIDVDLGRWTEQGVTVHDVKVEMRGVDAPLSEIAKGSSANVTARTATASAVVPYDVIKQRAPREVRRIGQRGDDLEVDLAGSVAGIPLSGSAVVEVKPTSRGIAITPVSVGADGGVQVPLALMRRQLTWTVPVTDLPVGSRISRVEPTPGGLRVAATAENVRLNDLPNT
ncbi:MULTISPECIES: LmeA family phospholipid-binding protein [Actinomadura]|uniref:DUF2993 domain-containing protein n=1 Tax=Actinomadura miaoliensis TaxID=430685 RepID=A0ABP7WZ79_9ACTN